ncbi:hypothetical protein IHQ68_09825 [Chelatococcus sambhunathii]|uniref:Uncharacterized protein n=1 Tax=Chelatococcus sambhunathii TaxID=363953 RepID=A0ABU1DFM7_9HYPH|nr:hypothetical protein [Chelatococcus sambhunathii]MDR4306915.1 hypothetical protein [Chelatococcus sambhunathii]
MTDESDSLILRYLRQIDVKVDRINRLLALDESAATKRERVSEAKRAARTRAFQLIRDMTPYNVDQTDSVILLREDRDR